MLDGVPARGPGGWLDLARFQGDLRKIVGFAESGDCKHQLHGPVTVLGWLPVTTNVTHQVTGFVPLQ